MHIYVRLLNITTVLLLHQRFFSEWWKATHKNQKVT